jgi:RNA polymerase sigma factor (sigma-70 family)
LNPALGCHDLLSKYQGGDQEAYAKLFNDKYQDLLQSVIKETRTIFDEMEAEVIVNRALFKVYEKITTYRGQTDGEAWGWMRTIARNMWKDTLRQKVRYEKRLVSLNDEICAGHLVMADDQHVDNISWLERLNATLTPRERQVFRLLQDGVSQTIIAAQLGLCLPRITQIKHSIRKKAQTLGIQAL